MLTDSKHFARLFVSIYIFCALTEHNPDFIASSSVSASRNVAVQCTRTKHSQLPLCVFIHFETNATSVHERFHTTHTHTVWLFDRPTFNIPAYRVPFPITTKYDPAIQQHLNVYIYKYYHTKLPYISFNTKYYFFALLAFYFTICGRRSAVIPCVAP